MNWENCDSNSEDRETPHDVGCEKNLTVQDRCTENMQKNHHQLQKLTDPKKDKLRPAYISTASRLGECLLNKIKVEDIQDLLVNDFEAFLFNFAEITPALHASSPTEFPNLYKEAQVVKRDVKEVNVDLDITIPTVFQVCYCEILDNKENKIVPQFSFEIFSFRDSKICKYRACFGCSSSFNEHHHPFTPTKKEIMFAKVKELNYAWADQPNLEKIASLLHESVEYKIWSWEDQKTFTFCKSDIVTKFRNLEEKFVIKSVVPYEVYSEGQYIMSNYVFHLEGENEVVGKKFMWLSTCIYRFDKDLNIVKISQQGELYPKDEITIPFKDYSREVIKQKVLDATESTKSKSEMSVMDTNDVNFSFEASMFHSSNATKVDYVRGFSEYEKLSAVVEMKNRDFEWEKVVDIYVDLHDPSYEVVISVQCAKTTVNEENHKYSGMELNLYSVEKVYLENGKVAKLTIFALEVPEPIPSPYDDPFFSAENIKSKVSRFSLE